MSFSTRCPACGTLFRVVADQLKISDGWVRCGHCSDVFDATVNLQTWVAPQTTSPERTAVPPEPADVPATESVAAPSVEPLVAEEPPTAFAAAPLPEDALDEHFIETRAPDMEVDAWAFAEAAAAPPTSESPASSASPTPVVPVQTVNAPPTPEGVDPSFEAELQRFAQSTGRAGALAPAPSAKPEPPSVEADEAAAPAVATGDPAAEAALVEPSFVRQARRRAFWTSPGVRAGLALLCLGLAGLLAGQWAVQERHRLLVSQPMLKPWLDQVCAWVACRMEAPRRIDAIVIDSSELVRRLGNFYSFDLVLKNSADIAVAVPALELSLTNVSDTVIARRVFLPQDWPNAPTVVPANGSLSVSFRLSLALGDASAMAGYRALVFYP